ncbi:MAG: hydroxymethylglutaryl-CoA reductase, degradative [Anaerolineaceae bacterium]|nr:hydroxymethylglutaryl-CoA reductase, degradative [Anaerolineaceae bacterium]
MGELKKFYQMTVDERRDSLRTEFGCSSDDLSALSGDPGLTEDSANRMIENVIGRYALPLGAARNFVINGRKYIIPMVIEEPSVVAAASNGARLAKAGGGFSAEADDPRMIGQLQITGLSDLHAAAAALEAEKAHLLKLAAESCPNLIRRGGGPVDMEFRMFPETDAGPMLIVHLIMDVRDVMGANLIDTALESIAPEVEKISGGIVRLRILSNLADQRLARAACRVPAEVLAFKEFDGETVLSRIVEAAAFAEADPYRAVTHNKGIMNGIDAVVLATGNDWRAVESGAHAWAAKTGQIRPLSHWRRDPENGDLLGTIELPMAVGTVGGATRVHPGAAAALRLMNVQSAQELAGVLAAVGLAQNLAALKALSTEGIQRGHMSLHAKQLAAAAGAQGELADRIAAQMVTENHISASYAAELAAAYIKESHHDA